VPFVRCYFVTPAARLAFETCGRACAAFMPCSTFSSAAFLQTSNGLPIEFPPWQIAPRREGRYTSILLLSHMFEPRQQRNQLGQQHGPRSMTSVERCRCNLAGVASMFAYTLDWPRTMDDPWGLSDVPSHLKHYLSLFGQTRAGPLSFLCRTNQSLELVPSRQVSPTHFTVRPEVGLGKALFA
jgi:hypothetical protein